MDDIDGLTRPYLITLQITGIIAAVALMAFPAVGAFVEWHGPFEMAVQFWLANVRPLIAAPVDYMIAGFGWNKALSVWLPDYLVIGLVLNVMALARLRRQQVQRGQSLGHTFRDQLSLDAVFWFVAILLAWPLVLPFTLWMVTWTWTWLFWFPDFPPARADSVLLIPVVYFAAFLAVNQWVLV